MWGQKMEISSFSEQKKGLLNYRQVVIDKKLALLDFSTGEKGFSFLADGKTGVEAEEGDGVVTLKVPHKTSFLLVKHPEYGQLFWKAPGKGLKKKKHYQANLLTYSPDKEYKVQNQWVVFNVQPLNAIVYVDSSQTVTRQGEAQFYLPLGKHPYRVECPFYKAVEDTLELTDSARLILPVTLQPIYSYLTVRTTLSGCKIYVDGEIIGQTSATSGHLNEGKHRLEVYLENTCYYDAAVQIGRAEKKTLTLSDTDLYPRKVVSKASVSRQIPSQKDSVPLVAVKTVEERKFTAPVTIKALDDSTAIKIDLDIVGYGTWEGRLEQGFHAICTSKDGVDSRLQYLWIDDETPKELELLAPLADYGVLSIHSNEIGAEIYLNDVLSGYTPCVIDHLPAGKKYQVRLNKEGFREAFKEVETIGNDLVDVNIKLKKI